MEFVLRESTRATEMAISHLVRVGEHFLRYVARCFTCAVACYSGNGLQRVLCIPALAVDTSGHHGLGGIRLGNVYLGFEMMFRLSTEIDSNSARRLLF